MLAVHLQSLGGGYAAGIQPPGRLRIMEGMMSILKKVNPIFLRAAMRAAYTLGSLDSVVSQ